MSNYLPWFLSSYFNLSWFRPVFNKKDGTYSESQKFHPSSTQPQLWKASKFEKTKKTHTLPETNSSHLKTGGFSIGTSKLPGVYFQVLLLLVSGRLDPHATSTTPISPVVSKVLVHLGGWVSQERGHPKKSPGIQVGWNKHYKWVSLGLFHPTYRVYIGVFLNVVSINL